MSEWQPGSDLEPMFLRNTASSSGTHLLLMGPQPTRLQRHSWKTQDSMSPSCQAVPRGRGPHWAFGFFMTPLCPQPQFLTSRSQIWPRWAAWSFAMAVLSLTSSPPWPMMPCLTPTVLDFLGVKCLTQAPEALCFLLCYTYHTEQRLLCNSPGTMFSSSQCP